MRKKVPYKATHRAVLATGETVDYGGAHVTHWSFGGVDANGNRDGSEVRVVPVVSRFHLSLLPPDDPAYVEPDEDEDE